MLLIDNSILSVFRRKIVIDSVEFCLIHKTKKYVCEINNIHMSLGAYRPIRKSKIFPKHGSCLGHYINKQLQIKVIIFVKYA